jgi:hypothetical protein
LSAYLRRPQQAKPDPFWPPKPKWLRQRHPGHRALVVAVGSRIRLLRQLLPCEVIPLHHERLLGCPHQEITRRDPNQVEVQVGDAAGVGGAECRRLGRLTLIRPLKAEIPRRPTGDD